MTEIAVSVIALSIIKVMVSGINSYTYHFSKKNSCTKSILIFDIYVLFLSIIVIIGKLLETSIVKLR